MNLGEVLTVGGADMLCEVLRAENLTAQVVAAIDMVANEGESCYPVGIDAHVCLGVAHDVGVTGAGKAVEDTSIAEVNNRVAHDGPLKGTAINEFRLGHFRRVIGGVA